MRLILILAILLIIPNSLAILQITEIMYNPEGSDNNHEYIELETNINLTGFIIQDSSSEDVLELLKYIPSNYSLIVEEGFNHSKINATIYSVGATIGNGLNNDGDIIIIKNNTDIFDVIHYYPSWGGENNGNSLCILNEQWEECLPSPGYENSEYQQVYNIKINELLPNPQGYDNADMPGGEWIELINFGNEINIENCYLKDLAGRTIDITTTHTYNTTIKNHLVVYLNGKYNGYMNNEGLEKISLFTPEGILIDEMSYDSSTEGLSWSKINEKWIQTVPSPNKENPENKTHLESSIKIEKVYLGTDYKAKFGDNLRVKLEIYKGNTTKNSISIWIEKNEESISKRTRFNIEKKYEDTAITVPIQIFPNCNEKLEDGRYHIKVEGLDKTDSHEIKIEGITKNLCEEIKYSSEKIYKESCSENNINPSNSTIDEIIYESTNKKTDRFAVYLLCLTLVFIIIQITTEKWKK